MSFNTKYKLESFITEITPADLNYDILTFQREYRELLPGYKLSFILETNIGPIITHITASNKSNTSLGDSKAGNYISGGRLAGEKSVGLRKWYNNNNIKVDDRVRIKVLEVHKRYELKKVNRRSL